MGYNIIIDTKLCRSDKGHGLVPAIGEAIMSTNDIAITTTPVSVKDGAYQQAKLHGTTRNLVSTMMSLIPGLGYSDDAITDEIKSELRLGYALKWAEDNPARYFMAVDKVWVERPEAEVMSSKAEKFSLDVHTAFGYTQQAFGALKNEDPMKHSLIKDVRDRFNKYVSNRINDLKRDAKTLYNERNGIKRDRAPVALFYDWVFAADKGAIAVMRQRCINAKSKGDETADIARLDKAIAAFKAKMNAKDPT